MQPMSSAEIRERFLRFFEERGHTRVPAAPLLARDDPTLLFVNAGMVPFKRVLTGEEKSEHLRVVNVQPVLRVAGKHNDFEEVGRTPRHQTLFEMLGSWSFGDYFKREAIFWHWELLTGVFGLAADRLAATVYTDDDEAAAIWADEIGLPPERIVRWGNVAAGDEKNFWSMGPVGPCGWCSELHYDRGIEFSEGPDCIPDHAETCPRWLEVGNLVFMSFDRASDGTLSPLPFKSVDTGTGLERLTSAIQDVDSNYRTDLFVPIVARLAEFVGHDPDTVESERFSYQVVADHSRAMTFLLAEGIRPGNEGAAYVLRRIIRRALRHGRLMGIDRPFLRQTCSVVIEIMGDAYASLRTASAEILDQVDAEEAKFARTLQAGSERLSALVDQAGAGGTIAGEEAFRLHDTFGFPIDLTVEMAGEQGVQVDRAGFDAAMEDQRERSRGTRQAAITGAAELEGLASEFIGYPNETRAPGLRVQGVSGELERTVVVLDRTPFYAEGGGQVGDRGELIGERGRLTVEDTQRVGEAIIHVGRMEGELREGDLVEAQVDEARRWGAARNHTGTHLLHRALRDVLGERAKQAGSYVAPESLRFDFPAAGPTPRSTLREVERIVNAQIRRDMPVTPEWMPIERARELGADMFFGEKYVPESVRVVGVEGYSKELCGGTHVAATGQIGAFRITGEASIGAGLRRIEAVTGEAAEELIAARLEALHEAAGLLGDREENVPARVEALLAKLREADKNARQPRSSAHRLDAAAALAEGQQAGKTTVVAQAYPDADADALRGLADDLRGMTGRFLLAAAAGSDGTPTLLVAASRDLVEEGFDASVVVREVAPLIGGGGGGRADLAQAGGKDPSRLGEALTEATRLALEALRRIESA
jgi:alanyl-tRNA synthetase